MFNASSILVKGKPVKKITLNGGILWLKDYLYEIPNEYRLVEFIQSLGEGFIRTDIHNDGNLLEGELKLNSLLSTTPLSLLASSDDGRVVGGSGFEIVYNNSAIKVSIYNQGNIAYAQIPISFNKFTFKLCREYSSINDVISYNLDGIIYNSTIPTNIFCRYINKINDRYSSTSCYWLKKYDSEGNLIKYLLPVVRVSDNLPGLYDVIQNTFYPPTGTIYAPDSIDNYTQLNAITSVDGAYINTKKKYANVSIEMEGMLLDDGTMLQVSLTGTASTSIFRNQNVIQIICWDNSRSNVTIPSDSNYHTFKITNNKLIIDDNLTNRGGFRNLDRNLCPFAIHGDNYVYNPTNSRSTVIKYLKLTDVTTGTIIANYIPVRRNSDNVIGMYDIVGNLFFENAGEGYFEEYKEYRELEYIQSSGT